MFAINVYNFPKSRVKLKMANGSEAYLYMKNAGTKKSRIMIQADKDIRISREYSIGENYSEDIDELEWEDERARSID